MDVERNGLKKATFALYFFFLFLLFPLAVYPAKQTTKPLKINLFSFRNGVGLETDRRVMQEALERQGHLVACINYLEDKKRKADINIFFEHPLPEKFSWAPLNWFVPNPEWYTRDLKLLDQMDLILCRTKEVHRIFSEKKYPVYYLGFTSPDCFDLQIQKDFSRIFHLAGASIQKGTSPILAIWNSDPAAPHLTVIKHSSDLIISRRNLKFIASPISERELRRLQNQCGIHLCPSETEGFGHYIMEALSAGAVVITTDAPPMNEFIQDPRCLVPYIKSSPCRLAINYYVDQDELGNRIKAVSALPKEELESIGKQNRAAYLRRTQEFYDRLNELLLKTAAKK